MLNRKLVSFASMPIPMVCLGMSLATPASSNPGVDVAPCVACGKNTSGMAEAGRVRFEQKLQAQYLADHGTDISLGEFKDDQLHRQLIQEIGVVGRSKKDRSSYYTWLDRMYPDIKCNGWRGRLVGAEPTADGLKVSLVVTPIITLPRHAAMSVMSLLETYVRTDKSLVYVSTEPIGVPGAVTFN